MQPSPRSRRKSKPSFDIPVDAGSPGTAAGWVYRAEESAPQPSVVIPITAGPAIERTAPTAEKPPATPVAVTRGDMNAPARPARPYHPAMIAGAGLFYVGAGSVVLGALGAAAVIGKPFRVVKGWFGIG